MIQPAVEIAMLWLLFCVLLAALPSDDKPVVLARVKQGVLDNLRRLPNYTCTETIERSYKRSSTRPFENVDRVRLEIGYVGGKELFGWPGGEKLADDDLGRLVGGTITNGDFALLSRALFAGHSVVFGDIREETHAGRSALRLSFSSPSEGSDWVLVVGGIHASAAYQGSLWVDSNSLQLMELQMTAQDIPPEFGYASITRDLQFQSTRIGTGDFLLPSRAELWSTDTSGAESKNETRFGACRQYSVESVISFDTSAPEAQGDARSPAAAANLPDEFEARLALESPIDSDTSAVGDPITARLQQSIKRKKETVVPEDALLHGRIKRLEVIEGRRYLELTFTYFEAGGRRVDIASRTNELITVSRRITGSQSAAPFPWSPQSPTMESTRSAGPVRSYGSHLVWQRGAPFLVRSTAAAAQRVP